MQPPYPVILEVHNEYTFIEALPTSDRGSTMAPLEIITRSRATLAERSGMIMF